MLSRHLAAGVLALAALALPARAEDTLRLSLPGSDKAQTLDLKATEADLAADTLTVARGRGGRGGGRGFARGRGFRGRGFRGRAFRGRGFRGRAFARRPFIRGRAFVRSPFFGRAFVRRPFFGRAFVRSPFFGRAFVRRPFFGRAFIWRPSFGSGFFWGGFYPSYYWYPGVYDDWSDYYTYPTSGAVSTVPSTTLGITPVPSGGSPPAPSAPAPEDSAPGTYPYDGGPRTPVPMPKADEANNRLQLPRRPALLDEVLVSFQENKGKWNYPAYGEKATRSGSPVRQR
jgi:hypothetical protein